MEKIFTDCLLKPMNELLELAEKKLREPLEEACRIFAVIHPDKSILQKPVSNRSRKRSPATTVKARISNANVVREALLNGSISFSNMSPIMPRPHQTADDRGKKADMDGSNVESLSVPHQGSLGKFKKSRSGAEMKTSDSDSYKTAKDASNVGLKSIVVDVTQKSFSRSTRIPRTPKSRLRVQNIQNTKKPIIYTPMSVRTHQSTIKERLKRFEDRKMSRWDMLSAGLPRTQLVTSKPIQLQVKVTGHQSKLSSAVDKTVDLTSPQLPVRKAIGTISGNKCFLTSTPLNPQHTNFVSMAVVPSLQKPAKMMAIKPSSVHTSKVNVQKFDAKLKMVPPPSNTHYNKAPASIVQMTCKHVLVHPRVLGDANIKHSDPEAVGRLAQTDRSESKPETESPQNYSIDHIGSDDSTDDENMPRKKLPQWAADKKRLLAHIKKIGLKPGEFSLMPKAVDLVDVFGEQCAIRRQRTSSAHWKSLYRTMNEDEQCTPGK